MTIVRLSRWLVCSPFLVFLACGGGGDGSQNSGPPPAQPSFSLSVNPGTLLLAQNDSQNVRVKVVPKNGFAGTVTVTASEVPSGVTVSPSSLSLSEGSEGTFAVSSGSNATLNDARFAVHGVAGSQTASANLSVSVVAMATPVAMPYTTTGGAINHAFYDEQRKLLFATNLYLNEVDVLSGSDLSLRARISVGQPFGIDQMIDGKTLVVGSATQGFYTIDEDTLSARFHVAPNYTSYISTTVLLTPVTMSNGKVLFLAQDVGTATFGTYDFAGQAIVEWDSASGQFSKTFYVPYITLTIDVLKRSADHRWAVFSADKLYIYNATTDAITSAAEPVNSAPFGVRDVAVNADGSKFAVISARSVSFYDSSFNLQANFVYDSLAGLIFLGHSGQFSPEGTVFYWELFGDQGGGSALGVIDSNTMRDLGNVSTNYGIQTQVPPNLLLVDQQQRAFFSALGGVGTKQIANLHTGPPTIAGGLRADPVSVPLNQAVSVTINIANSALPSGTAVTIGGKLAPLQSLDPMTVLAPASSVPGPVDVVLTQPDGASLIEPRSFVYGAKLDSATASLAPPIGSPVVGLFGFGIIDSASSLPSVTLGGQAINNMLAATDDSSISQELLVQLPNGPSGPADLSITSSLGTSTLKAAITYIPFAEIIPSTPLLQLLYDTHRDLLYALQENRVSVLNPATLRWQTPYPVDANPLAGYTAFTLTPDGSKLLVLDGFTKRVVVFNPDIPQQSTVISLPLDFGTNVFPRIAATNTGKAYVGTNNGFPLEIDIAGGTVTTMTGSAIGLSKFVATPDGTHMFAFDEADNSGLLATWHSSTDTFSVQRLFATFWTDLAVSPDGSLAAAVAGNLDYAGAANGIFDAGLHFINATVYPDLAPPDQPFCVGSILSPSGKILISPLADSIDFFSTATGKMVARLATPELLPTGDASAGVLALDPSGQTLYAISESGLTVLTLPSPVDQVPQSPWPHGARSSDVQVTGVKAQSRWWHGPVYGNVENRGEKFRTKWH